MQDFMYDDKTVEFVALTGEVVGSEKLNETHVSASSSGGHSNSVQVNSSNVINHEFWVRDDAGVEHDVKLRGHDVPLRTGQRVTIISSRRKQASGTLWYSVLVNHSANKHWFLKHGSSLVSALRLTPYNFKQLLVGFALFVVLGYVTGAYLIAFLVGVGYIVYKYRSVMKRHWEATNRLDAHLEQLTQQAYEHERAREAA